MSEEIYLVRGAKLQCTFGSHIRKLNLPLCHGVYAKGHPMIHELDCVPGDSNNIPSFGVCKSPMVLAMNPGPPEVVLKEVLHDGNGNPIETGGIVVGPMCLCAIPDQKWQNTYTLTRIVDNGSKDAGDSEKDLDDPSKGYPAATTSSFVMCAFGGKIVPETSGQENPSG